MYFIAGDNSSTYVASIERFETFTTMQWYQRFSSFPTSLFHLIPFIVSTLCDKRSPRGFV